MNFEFYKLPFNMCRSHFHSVLHISVFLCKTPRLHREYGSEFFDFELHEHFYFFKNFCSFDL